MKSIPSTFAEHTCLSCANIFSFTYTLASLKHCLNKVSLNFCNLQNFSVSLMLLEFEKILFSTLFIYTRDRHVLYQMTPAITAY